MPMSNSFREKLFRAIPEIVATFGTPFHIYDGDGIIRNGWDMKQIFAHIHGFQEFFAVKACPNLVIQSMLSGLGFGSDCSSIPELVMSKKAGVRAADRMFTSNNTSQQEFAALDEYGGILNLDDVTMIPNVPRFPELICFRYNPGERRRGNELIGNPVEAKYGVRDDQIVDAYRRARWRGANRFGLHTMICSNQCDYTYMVETVRMLLEVVERVSTELGITLEFINVGGGIGIPYRPGQEQFNLCAFAKESSGLLDQFRQKFGYVPKFFMECGRYVTGPFGVLVTKVINRMSKYREYVGVDACMSSLMRPAMYDAYHHIEVVGGEGRPVEVVDVVGALCENNDKFAKQRSLPKVSYGDILVIQDTGAHGYAMCFTYNGRLRPKELLFDTCGDVRLIRRAETLDDYLATQSYDPQVLHL